MGAWPQGLGLPQHKPRLFPARGWLNTRPAVFSSQFGNPLPVPDASSPCPGAGVGFHTHPKEHRLCSVGTQSPCPHPQPCPSRIWGLADSSSWMKSLQSIREPPLPHEELRGLITRHRGITCCCKILQFRVFHPIINKYIRQQVKPILKMSS